MTEQEEFEQFTKSMTAPAPEAPAVEPQAAPEVPVEPATTEVVEPAAKPAAEPTKVEPPKEPEKKTDWAALAARDKEKRQAKIAARLAADDTAKKLADAQAKAAQLDEIMSLSKADRLKALERLGMTVDDVNTAYVRSVDENPNKPPPYVAALEKQLADQAALLKQIADRDAKRDAEALEQRRAEAVRSIEASVGDAIKTKADDFELLSKHKQGREIVINLLAAHHEETGEVLGIEEACRRVEEHLLEDLKPFAETKKFRATVKGPADTQTISGDLRQSEARGSQGADEDSEFLNTGLRLLTQAG